MSHQHKSQNIQQLHFAPGNHVWCRNHIVIMNRTFKIYHRATNSQPWSEGSVATGPDADASLEYMNRIYALQLATGEQVKLVEEVIYEKIVKTNVPQIPIQPC